MNPIKIPKYVLRSTNKFPMQPGDKSVGRYCDLKRFQR